MKDVKEIQKSIILLVKYPTAFAYKDFGDRGNSCIGRQDKLDLEDTMNYAATYQSVLMAMPKYSALHKAFGWVLQVQMGLKKYPNYDTTVKMLARLLGDDQLKDSHTIKQMCLFASRVQDALKSKEGSMVTKEGGDQA